MQRVVVVALAASCVVSLARAAEDAAVIIDGKPIDRFWQSIAPAKLVPVDTGVPVILG